MKKLIITSIITLKLIAQSAISSENPAVYSVLGDQIYNNIDKIEKLQSISGYDKSKIQKYIKDVGKTKKIGYKIEDGDKSINKGDYLKLLRDLSAVNDYYIYKVRGSLKGAIKSEDNDLFLININTGLISIDKNKDIIKKYYYAHKDDINITGTVIEDIIINENKKPIYKGSTKTNREKLEIERIRKKDKAKQEKIEKILEDEVIRKKTEIRKNQKQELGIKTK